MPDMPPQSTYGPDSFGDVTAEYLALRSSAALVEGRLDVVWIRGEDSVSFLQGILSQDVAAMGDGDVTRTFLLQPNGKLECLAWVFRDSDGVGLVVERGWGESTRATLARYLIRVKAQVTVEERAISELWGPHASMVLADHGLATADGWKNDVLAFPLHHLPRFLVLGPVSWSPEVARAGRLAIEAVRIEGGEAMNGVDINEATIPQETGLVGETVSFTKGCYLGQELVARIDSRGHVNRHFRGLAMASNVLPPTGAILVVEEKTVGTLTSVAESLTQRAPIGLALVRREVAPGDDVMVQWESGSVRARVVALPFDDFTNL